jgi:hypothetical protein
VIDFRPQPAAISGLVIRLRYSHPSLSFSITLSLLTLIPSYPLLRSSPPHPPPTSRVRCRSPSPLSLSLSLTVTVTTMERVLNAALSVCLPSYLSHLEPCCHAAHPSRTPFSTGEGEVRLLPPPPSSSRVMGGLGAARRGAAFSPPFPPYLPAQPTLAGGKRLIQVGEIRQVRGRGE